MQIGIIGTGRMAGNLAKGWDKAGHTVMMGSRSPKDRDDMPVPVTTHAEVLEDAEVIVIGLPFPAVKPFVEEYSAVLKDKLVIDISNPFGNLPDNRISGSEITAQAIGDGARVVAAFKTNFWETLLEPVDPKTNEKRDVLIAGDSTDDKATVSGLIEDLGFRPVDCGALEKARILDGMVTLIVELDTNHANSERRLSWKVMG